MTIPTSRVRELRDHCVFMTRLPVEGTALKPSDHRPVTREMMWDMARLLEAELTRRDAEAREGWEQRCDIYRQERDRFAAQSARMAEILGGIVAIIPKDFVASDGRIMQFVPPDPLMYLRALANSISKAYAALTDPPPVPNVTGEKL